MDKEQLRKRIHELQEKHSHHLDCNCYSTGILYRLTQLYDDLYGE